LTTVGATDSAVNNNCISKAKRSRESSNIHTTQYIGQSSKAAGVQWEFWKSGQIHHSMQAIYTDEDERNTSRKTNIVGTIICIGRISRHLEGKYTGGLGRRITEI